jgi:hypothetical protein
MNPQINLKFLELTNLIGLLSELATTGEDLDRFIEALKIIQELNTLLRDDLVEISKLNEIIDSSGLED